MLQAVWKDLISDFVFLPTGVQIEGYSDISVQNTECLKFLKYSAPGWILAQRVDTSEIGLIPLAFVKKVKHADQIFSSDTRRVPHPPKRNLYMHKVSTLPRNVQPLLAISNALRQNPNDLTEDDFGITAEDSDLNLIFSQNAHGETEIRAATLDKLIEKVTCSKDVPARLPHDILLTYSTFTTSEILLEKLEARFFPQSLIVKGLREQDLAIFNKRFLEPIRLRVLNTMKIWIEDHWRSYFRPNFELVNKVSNFIKQIKTVEKFQNMTIRLSRTIDEKLTSQAQDQLTVHQMSQTQLTSPVNLQKGTAPPLKLPDQKLFENSPHRYQWKALHPEEVARQLSLVDYDTMNQILPADLLTHVKTPQKERDPDSIVLKSIARFNRISSWVPSTICLLERRSHRVEALYKLSLFLFLARPPTVILSSKISFNTFQTEFFL